MLSQLGTLSQVGDFLPADCSHQVGCELILQNICFPLAVISLPHKRAPPFRLNFGEIQTAGEGSGIEEVGC